jgi:hypothetical protein
LSNVLKVKVSDKIDSFSNLLEAQMLTCEQEDVTYFVQNLDQCPEDAIIYRDLFSAADFIATLKMGMELRDKGYEEIEVEWEEGLI